MIRSALFAAATVALLTAPSFAHDYTVGSLKIDHPWTRATPKGASVGGGYLKITNNGTAPDRLVSGSSPVSQRFEIHSMVIEGGMMKMRPVEGGLEIKPGETVELKPGGYHVMFLDLNQPLVKDEKVNATLVFEKAGKVDVSFTVEAIGTTRSGDMNHGGAAPMKHGQ